MSPEEKQWLRFRKHASEAEIWIGFVNVLIMNNFLHFGDNAVYIEAILKG